MPTRPRQYRRDVALSHPVSIGSTTECAALGKMSIFSHSRLKRPNLSLTGNQKRLQILNWSSYDTKLKFISHFISHSSNPSPRNSFSHTDNWSLVCKWSSLAPCTSPWGRSWSRPDSRRRSFPGNFPFSGDHQGFEGCGSNRTWENKEDNTVLCY